MDEDALLVRLRAGDEMAFRELVAAYGGRLARFARAFTRDDAVIAEAVQETWLALVAGLHRFEGRSRLSTWLFGVLANQARRLAVREARHSRHARLPEGDAGGEREPGMGPDGRWRDAPVPWGLGDPEGQMLARETLAVVEAALAALPPAQRQVVLLRDVEGLDAATACNVLGLADTHQRVLLHRGRARVRRTLDAHLRGEPVARSEATR